MKKNIAFAFIDETGIAAFTASQPYFGVGIFTTHKTTLLNKQLHDILVRALSSYKITKDKFEFKFSHIHRTNLKFYKKIVETLKQHKNDWNFAALIENKQETSWTQMHLWENYLGKVKILVSGKKEELVIIADYLSKPNIAKVNFDTLLEIENVRATLQLESQGSLLLQVTDILLGALTYHIQKKKNIIKKALTKEVIQLLKYKKMRVTELGSSPATYFYNTER